MKNKYTCQEGYGLDQASFQHRQRKKELDICMIVGHECDLMRYQDSQESGNSDEKNNIVDLAESAPYRLIWKNPGRCHFVDRI